MDSPKIPTLKDSQKPQVKVRGLEAGVTLFDRLKQFKKKDLAFILAGLGTLFMAPLAEHFMMAPETGSDLQAGMGGKGGSGSGLFNGSGSSPYEPGAGGLAQGSPSGGGSDIITPLNVRDPSALVMGPGATQQPPTQSVAPATPPPTAPVARNDSDLKDALAASARGVSSAAKAAKALLPVPKVALQGAGGLRGLGVVSGGSSAVGSLGPINSSNSLSKANTGGGLSAVKAVPGYRGAAGSRGQSSGGSGLDALKAAADKAGERMNQGSAAAALDATAAQAIPNGGSGLGGNGAGGTGAGDKGFGGNQDKSGKNVGESLEFLKQKAMQEAKIALWAKEKEANDMNLQMANMRNDALKTIVGAAATSLGKCVGSMVTGGACVDPTLSSNYSCTGPDGGPTPYIPSSQITKGAACAPGGKDGATAAFFLDTTTGIMKRCDGSLVGDHCRRISSGVDDSSGGDGKPKTNPRGTGEPDQTTDGGPVTLPTGADLKNLHDLCDKIKGSRVVGTDPKTTELNGYVNNLYAEARHLVVVRDAIYTGKDSGECQDPGAPSVPGIDTGGKSIQATLQKISDGLRGDNGAIKKIKDSLKEKADSMPREMPGLAELTAAEADLAKVTEYLNAAQGGIPKAPLAHEAALPELWKGKDTSGRAAIFNQSLLSDLGAAQNSVAAATKIKDALVISTRQLDLVVKSGGTPASPSDATPVAGQTPPTTAPTADVTGTRKATAVATDHMNNTDQVALGQAPTFKADPPVNTEDPTLKGVLTNRVDLQAQTKKAESLGVKESAAAAPTPTPTPTPTVTPAPTATPMQIPAGLKPALTWYETNKATVDSAPEDVKTKVAKQLGDALRDTKGTVTTSVTTQSSWLDSIQRGTPTAAQIQAK